MSQPGHIYFHAPCFDGLVSAALTAELLDQRDEGLEMEPVPVNYSLRKEWLASPIASNSAVVDFLYHPNAAFWADHHTSTFLDAAVQRDYEQRKGPHRLFNPGAASCAGLIWSCTPPVERPPRLAMAVAWADRIDAARYDTVEQALSATLPAMQIQASLGARAEDAYYVRLVGALRRHSLSEIATLPEVRQRSQVTLQRDAAGMDRLRQDLRLEQGSVARFEVNLDEVGINRYAPFALIPEARYALGILRSGAMTTVRANCNPWLDFPAPPLGQMFAREGGGGHARVGSVNLSGADAGRAAAIADRIEAAIVAFEVRHAGIEANA